MTAERRWGTKGDVAQHLHVSTKTVDRLVARGEIRAYPVGPRLVRFDLAEIDATMTAQETH